MWGKYLLGYSEEDMQESYKKGYANGQMDAFIN
jgi:hypothetical protein